MRWVIAALVVVGLAVGVVLAWPSGTENPPDTLADATTTTSTSVPPETTTSVTETTTTTADDGETSHVVETVAEAEEILRNLWFGWFEGIYNEDEDRIREVVATKQMLDAALNAFEAPFLQEPSAEAIDLDLEILRADTECLAVWGSLDVRAFRGPDGLTESLQVLRFTDEGWKFATSWVHRDDLWEADCEAELPPLPS